MRLGLSALLKLLTLTTVVTFLIGPTWGAAKKPKLSIHKTTQAQVKAKKSFAETYTESLTSSFSNWGLDPHNKTASINLLEGWTKFKKNKEIVVAVIDTGIDPNHPLIKNNLYVYNGKMNQQNNYGVDFSNTKVSETPFDTHGHGTHVAGIIKNIFPEVKILALKYYNPKASGLENLNYTIKALEYAVNHNVDVINYSGGGPEPSADELRILKEAERKGILVIAAAGNERSDIDDKKNGYYPASYGLSNIVTVLAHDENNQTIASSNWGKKTVDLAAPGNRIRSSVPNGNALYMTGTSQATAFVSGVVALLKARYPDLNSEQIKNILISSAKKEKTLEGKCLAEGRLDAGHAFTIAEKLQTSKSGVAISSPLLKKERGPAQLQRLQR